MNYDNFKPTQYTCPITFFTDDGTVEPMYNPEPVQSKPQAPAPAPTPSLDGSTSFNLGFFMSDDAKIMKGTTENTAETKKKRAPRKKADGPDPMTTVVPIDPTVPNNGNVAPYSSTYNETNAVLQTAISQSDVLLGEIKQDIDTIRGSKTLKSKYTYITNLTASAASLINTRIAAAREMNSSITQSHNLELKRAKDNSDMNRDDKNDDAKIMDMYHAFINAPMGHYDNSLQMPTVSNMMLGVNDPTSGVSGVSMVTQGGMPDSSTAGLSPEQVRMRFESNPNIEEVVRYDAASGRRWFEVIDKTNGQSIPGYPTTDNFILEDCNVDTRSGIARNRNLDKVWRVETIGSISEY